MRSFFVVVTTRETNKARRQETMTEGGGAAGATRKIKERLTKQQEYPQMVALLGRADDSENKGRERKKRGEDQWARTSPVS